MPAGKRPAMFAAAVVACALLAVAGTLAALRLTSSGPADPALAELITEVTTVPVGTPVPARPVSTPAASSCRRRRRHRAASAYSSTLLIDPGTPAAVSGPPLTEGGQARGPVCRHRVLPLLRGRELAADRRAQPVRPVHRPDDQQVAAVRGHTADRHLDVLRLVLHQPLPGIRSGGDPLQRPGKPQGRQGRRGELPRAAAAHARRAGPFRQVRQAGSTPFIDFANRAAQTGSGMLPDLVAGRTWQQLAAALRQPKTTLGATLLNEADTLTAELCRLTGGRPAAACPHPRPAKPNRLRLRRGLP